MSMDVVKEFRKRMRSMKYGFLVNSKIFNTEYDKYHRHDKTGQSKRKPDGKHATQQSKTNRPRSANAD